MEYKVRVYLRTYILLLCLPLCGGICLAQSTMPNGTSTTGYGNSKPKDTSMNKSNTAKWKEEEARITYEKLNSARVYTPDTSLHTFQRNPFTQPWYQDLGNLGSPASNLLFTPEDRFTPTLGYHIFDAYRFNIDSLNFYNTNRPYSVFSYQLGSKLEQYASILHTQNIRPNWNFSFQYRKLYSPGFYKTERNNQDNACFTTNYKSLDKHYVLYAAMVYNKEQHDENGGIINDSELSLASYSDKGTIDQAYQNSGYSTTRSSVSNVLRDFSLVVQHSYTWGKTDTTYNADSTQYSYHLKPRFSITHKLEISTEKHTYNDVAPDSLQYVSLFNHSFISSGRGYYASGEDSVFTQQKWVWIDNRLLLNGFIGKEDRQLKFSAGIGNRYDEFISQPVAIPYDSMGTMVYRSGLDRTNMVSNYVVGEIKKEALQPGQWQYGAYTQLFITGEDAGNLLLNAAIGKDLKNGMGNFVAGFQEKINSAPYSYTNYENQYAMFWYTFNKENVTQIYATVESQRLRVSLGVKDYVIGNYIYINEGEMPAQYNVPFTITQVWGRKVFKAGNFYLDNELVYQDVPVNAPVNAPAFMGRHQLRHERDLFNRKLKIVVGIEVRYNTAYYPAGYDALLNKFYYQKSVYIGNAPQEAVFLNFRIKRFRAFVMGDNLQELFTRNAILNVGTPVVNYYGIGNTEYPVYAAPDALIRFGFNWVLVN